MEIQNFPPRPHAHEVSRYRAVFKSLTIFEELQINTEKLSFYVS